MDTKQLKLMTLTDAVERIEDGMILGIGTGSTIELLVPEIAKLIEKAMNLKAYVPQNVRHIKRKL